MIYFIVPTFGRLKLTEQLIASVKESLGHESYMVIIIDDHPNLPTYQAITETKKIKILASKTELWWCGSINKGIDYLLNELNPVNLDICIFVNNDITIDGVSWKEISDEIKQNKNQILHPKTLDNYGKEMSSGCIIKSWFPFITYHPIASSGKKTKVDLCSARFLVFTVETLKRVGLIDPKLIQYQGDHFFSYKAKIEGVESYILNTAHCKLDHSVKNNNNVDTVIFSELIKSFFSIKTSNHILSKYNFSRNFFNPMFAFMITASMTGNVIIKFIIRRIEKSVKRKNKAKEGCDRD